MRAESTEIGAGLKIGACVGIIGGIFFGDLLLKNNVEKKVTEGSTRELLGGRILLRKHHNKGAFLNWGEQSRPLVAAVSVVLTLVAAILLLCSFGHAGNGMLQMGLSLLLGGAFSNTYDRLKRKYVVDYVSFGVKWKGLRRVVFNISDFCIIIGALLTALAAAQ